jgi:hypothetical protein
MFRRVCTQACEPLVVFTRLAPAVFVVLLTLSGGAANATTKGLNQIVTPDIQPEGALSLSIQQQDPTIGNRGELQTELGITDTFEIAVFQGDSPADQIGNAELGLYNRGPYLLSTGFLNWTTKGTAPQPFLEGGYYKGNGELVLGAINVVDQETTNAGAIRNTHSTQALLGVAYRPTPRLQVQADYQGGSGNFSTAGFTYSITPSLSFNPAIYVSNSTPVKGYGYAVLTWTIQAFAPKNAQPATAPAAPSPKPAATPNPSG